MQNIPKIARERLKAATPGANHPDANLLSAFAERSLTARERTAVVDHLARCGDCREIVALALTSTESGPTTAQPSPARRMTWPALRWGFITAGVAVIATFGVVQYQRQVEPSAQRSMAAPGKDGHPDKLELAAKNLPAAPAQGRTRGQDIPVKKALKKSIVAGDSVPSNPTTAIPLRKQQVFAPVARSRQAVPSARASIGVGHGFLGGSTTAEAWQHRDQSSVAFSPAAPQPGTNAEASQRVSTPANAQAQGESVEVTAGGASQVGSETSQLADQSLTVPHESEDKIGKAKSPVSAELSGGAPGMTAGSTKKQGTSGLNGRNFTQLIAVAPGVVPRWTIGPSGGLQRSFDHGASWQDVDVAAAVSAGGPVPVPIHAPVATPIFRAVVTIGPDVWAGGAGAALYHSSDSGNSWARVIPASAGTFLTGDIISLEFADSQHGTLATSTPEHWTTADGGQTWQKQ